MMAYVEDTSLYEASAKVSKVLRVHARWCGMKPIQCIGNARLCIRLCMWVDKGGMGQGHTSARGMS